jgi:predicted dienelactone hydrolase
MVHLDSRQLLQSVTRLIEKPDVKAFELSLIETLREIISTTSIRFCQLLENPEVAGQKLVVYTEPNETASDAEVYKTVTLESDPTFAECLQTEKKIVVSNPVGPGVLVIHPVKAKRSVIGFLVIRVAPARYAARRANRPAESKNLRWEGSAGHRGAALRPTRQNHRCLPRSTRYRPLQER